jgi:GNAT superfamily N-acetyltransferase
MPDHPPDVEGAEPSTRRAVVDDAARIAEMLHEFNMEFDTETPGAGVLARRLGVLLSGASTLAILGGEPAVGVALVTLRTNVWSDGPVALLDEMYVEPDDRGDGVGSAILQHMVEACRELGVAAIEINVDESDAGAMRFYERHGFSGVDPDTGERAFYFYRSLGSGG